MKWDEKPLGEVLKLIIDYRGKTPGKLKGNWSKSGVPTLSAKHIKEGRIIKKDGFRYVDRELYRKWMKKELAKNDILLTSEAPLGELYYLDSNEKYCLGQRLFALRTKEEVINPKFLYFFLNSEVGQHRLKERATGTTVRGIRQSELRELLVPVPNMDIQLKIGTILFDFEDLIKKNIKRIQILERIAQIIYEEWFVRLRYPGYENAEIIQTRYGPKPKGWQWKRIGDVIEFAYGKALKETDRVLGDFLVYGSSGVVGSHDTYLVEGPTIIVGRKGNVGSIYWSHDNCYPIDTVFYIKTNVSLYYIYFNFHRQNFINSDAAVPGLSRRQAYNLPILIPNQSILDLFEEHIKPIFEQTYNLEKKNENLCRIKDVLLPKLILGEIDISELGTTISGD